MVVQENHFTDFTKNQHNPSSWGNENLDFLKYIGGST
jgi:hypothetical protein